MYDCDYSQIWECSLQKAEYLQLYITKREIWICTCKYASGYMLLLDFPFPKKNGSPYSQILQKHSWMNKQNSMTSDYSCEQRAVMHMQGSYAA